MRFSWTRRKAASSLCASLSASTPTHAVPKEVSATRESAETCKRASDDCQKREVSLEQYVKYGLGGGGGGGGGGGRGCGGSGDGGGVVVKVELVVLLVREMVVPKGHLHSSNGSRRPSLFRLLLFVQQLLPSRARLMDVYWSHTPHTPIV